MLVLTRKVNESIIITDETTGAEIKIMVTSARGEVRLGFEASQNYKIMRTNAGKNKKQFRRDDTL